MLKFLFGLILAAIWLLPSVTFAQSRNVWIDGDHGRLSAVIQTPNGQNSYPLVVICHGFTANKNQPMLMKLADYLEAAGIASIRFDFNGHGDSEGRFQDMTVPNEIEDVKHVIEYARDMRGVTSVSVAGHSQGGVVTSMVAGQLGSEEIKSIALMAPAAVLRDDAIRGLLFGNQYDSINLAEYYDFDIGRGAQTLPIYETAENYDGPVFIVHGLIDTVVPYTYALRYQEIYHGGAELELLEGFDHSFTQNDAVPARLVADYFISQLK